MSVTHLNQVELAARWKISPRTLERWRWTGDGPAFIKIGGRVVYRLEDVETYERTQLRASTADTTPTQSPARLDEGRCAAMDRAQLLPHPRGPHQSVPGFV